MLCIPGNFLFDFFICDVINTSLNLILPFQLQSNYTSRENKIKQCIDVLASEVRSLKQEKDSRPDNIQLLKHLRREQTSLRLLQTELGVEEVIKERTMKVFHEHCRNYYKLPDASS
jgi:hypothetical protein